MNYKIGLTFFIGYSPEREDQGNKKYNTKNIPKIVSGQFDYTKHKAVWPSTGNYCRGGVAISKILGCRSVAVLPEGMSEERFNKAKNWF